MMPCRFCTSSQLTGNKEVVDDCVRQMTKLQNKLVPQYQQELWGLVKISVIVLFLKPGTIPGQMTVN